MILKFDYQMRLFYSEEVRGCHFTIKCIPKETQRQHLAEYEIKMLPKTLYSFGKDSFENRQIYGHISEAHDSFFFGIKGLVESLDTDLEEEAEENHIALYRYPHGKCIPGEKIKAVFHKLEIPDGNAREKSMAVMHGLHNYFVYAKAKTGMATSAEEAMSLGMGVCQDYAQISISLLRMAGIPARYVCGFMAGEGESHAWVEYLHEGKWYGFDPTNDCPIGSGYIKLGDGRDSADCAINRATMYGGGSQRQEVTAIVTEE